MFEKKKRAFFIHVQEPKMFCRKCGEEVKEIDNFCGKCGEKQQQKTVTEKKEVKTLSLDSYKQFKREERAGHFKPSKSSTSTSTITRKSEPLMHNVTINVETMKNVNLNLKPVRGKKLPLKVKIAINYDDLKKRAIEKHSHHDQSFCGLEEYVLLYPDGREALFLPEITSTRYQLDSYKEELGKPYSQIVLYLCSTSRFDNVSCGAIEFPDPNLSLPGIATNHFDKIYESEMPVLVDDHERDTFQILLNEFPERYTVSVTAGFLHLSADKDTVIKDIIHRCYISLCLEEIRSVQKGMSTLGLSIVLFFFQFPNFFLSRLEP